MKLARQSFRWSLLVFTLAAFCGCNTLLGPVLSTGGGGGGNPIRLGPEILVVNPNGTTGWTRLPQYWSAKPAGSLTDPGTTPNQVQVTERMDGSVGGKMRCGRFFLMVPPGAFVGTGAITMSMADSTVMVCDVEISPRELNGFLKPVHLALSINDSDASTDTLTMYWFDQGASRWVDLGCEKDLTNSPEVVGAPCPPNMTGIMTPLAHFSRYGGGKAGW